MSGSSTRLAPRRVTGTASYAAKRLPSAAVSTTEPWSPTSLDRGGDGGRWSLEKHMLAVCNVWPAPARATRPAAPAGEPARLRSGVDALAVEPGGRVDDEVLAGRDVVAHEQVEDPFGHLGVLEGDPAQGALPGVHRRLRELVGVHLPEALVALQRLLDLLAPLLQRRHRLAHLTLVVGVDEVVLLGAGVDDLDAVQGRHGGVDPARLDQGAHVAEEEGQQQGADVGAVDVGVGH